MVRPIPWPSSPRCVHLMACNLEADARPTDVQPGLTIVIRNVTSAPAQPIVDVTPAPAKSLPTSAEPVELAPIFKPFP